MVPPSDRPAGVRGTTPPLQTDALAKGRRFQFRLSMLFFCVLVVAVATQQILSPHWTGPERWLLTGWFIGWLGGLTYSRACGKRGILAATVAGTLCGFIAALILYTGFADYVRKRTLPFRDEVIYPLMALFLLALVSSAALAAAYHVTAFVVRKHLRRVQDDFTSRRLVRAWLATGITAVPVVALLASWVALLFAWRPVATLDIRHAFDGSGPGVAFSPDNKLLALGSDKGFVELWELPALKRSARHDVDLARGAWFVEFSSDGKRLAYGSGFDPRLRIIGIDSGESQVEVNVTSRFISATSPYVSAIAFGDQALVVIASSASHKLAISLWDQATGAQTKLFRVDVPGWAPAVHVNRGLFAYLQRRDLLSSGPSRIALHALNDGRHLASGPIVHQEHSVFRPCFSHDGDWVCMLNVVWNHQTDEAHQMPGHGMGFLPDGRLIIVQTGKTNAVPLYGWRAIWLYRTPILRRFVIHRPWSRLAIYDVQTRRILRTSATQDGYVHAWISPDGTTMATLGSKRELKIWRVPALPSPVDLSGNTERREADGSADTRPEKPIDVKHR